MKKFAIHAAAAVAALTFGAFASAGVASAAPARHHKPVPLATACFYGGVTGDACAGLPTPANDFDGRPTPLRWDPCVPGGHSTLIYLQPCTRRTVSMAGWCRLHFDHHTLWGQDVCHR